MKYPKIGGGSPSKKTKKGKIMKRTKKEKYTKGEKLMRYKLCGSGKWSSYKEIVKGEELEMLEYAASKGLVLFGNDAPRGGKLGKFIEILRDFTVSELEAMRSAELKARDEALAKVLKSELVDEFFTASDIGSIKIDGICYSNFYGDGENRVEVCKRNFENFKIAEVLTRRQVFNPKKPITIMKFDAPKAIEIALSDVDEKLGVRKIENACGFVIWERKAKIFVTNE